MKKFLPFVLAFGLFSQFCYAATTDGQLLIGSTSANSFKPATLTAGSNITITNGDGTIQIDASAGSGSPGGSSGQIQYNNSGVFGGLTDAQLTARINSFTSSLSGSVPFSGGGTSNFLRADGSWSVPTGSGTVGAGTLNQAAIYTGTGVAVGGTSAPSWFDAVYCNTVGYILVRTTGAWTCDRSIPLNAKWFGAVADGSHPTEDRAAFASMKAILQTNSVNRGGKIYAPGNPGKYSLNPTSLAFTSYDDGAGTIIHNIEIYGDGPLATVFNLTGTTGDGLSINEGSNFYVRDLKIENASAIGLNVGAGNGASDYTSNIHFDNVWLQGNGTNVSFTNTFSVYGNLISKSASGTSCVFSKLNNDFHLVATCSNSSKGLDMSGGSVTGGTLDITADSNTNEGAIYANLTGVKVHHYGESNGKDCAKLVASDAVSTGFDIPTNSQDIHGADFTMVCYANSTASAGTYGSLMSISSSNSRLIEASINGAHVTRNASGDRALVVSTTGGNILLHKTNVNISQFTTDDSYSVSGGAKVQVVNHDMTGRRMIVTNSGTQSLTNNTETTVTLNTTSENDMGGTLSSNAITIPKYVRRVRIIGAVEFSNSSATGIRYAYVQKNGSQTYGFMTIPAFSGYVHVPIISPPIDVTTGDTFTIRAMQNSGGALNIDSGATVTTLSVEAVW